MWPALLLAVLAAVCVGGCEGSSPNASDAAQSPFERDLQPKLAQCLGCHGGSTPEGGLDLADIQALVGVQSAQLDMALIEPGDHLQSYLWHKVAGTQSIAGGLGRQMPTNERWSDEDVDLLARWIDLGAPR